jgi:hypothetical protein
VMAYAPAPPAGAPPGPGRLQTSKDGR